MSGGFETQPLATQHVMRLQSTKRETELTAFLIFFRGKLWLTPFSDIVQSRAG
jgi:hypothetical protein